MLTFGSLFAGIGGMDLGLERAGMKCVWQCEIDDYATRVLEKHWPTVRRHRDVRTFPPRPKRDWLCDVVAGGFPCQPVSCAGRRQAQRDPRWLWPHFARTVRVLRPSYVIVENVPGLLSTGYGFGDVVGDLAAMGFDAEWAVLPACAFGATHPRERVFVVAYAAGKRKRRVSGGQRTEGQGTNHAGGRGETCSDVDGKRRQGVNGRPKTDVAAECAESRRQEAINASNANGNGICHEARIYRAGGEITALPYACWGPINPAWAELLMGFPIGWSELEGSATPSSRKSRSSSAGSSSKTRRRHDRSV